jgi:nucleoside-diphosphate-sugar epimerase
MRVVITGGAGFIGHRLAEALLAKGSLVDQSGQRRDISELVIFDQAEPSLPLNDSRVRVILGDMTQKQALSAALGNDVDTIFHLAGVVSGGAEADLRLGLAVNLDGTRLLLDLAADTGRKPKLIFASTLAVYGGPEATVVNDKTLPTPMSSYGVQKLCSILSATTTAAGWLMGVRCAFQRSPCGRARRTSPIRRSFHRSFASRWQGVRQSARCPMTCRSR